MIDGLRAALRGLNDVRRQGYVYIWANLAFVALSLPIVTMPAAYAALCRVSHTAQTEPHGADLGLFWDTFKTQVLKALPWGLLMALLAFVNVTNLLAYAPYAGLGVYALRVAWVAALIIWIALLLYTWPMYYEMAEPTVWGATRNAFVLVLRNPFFTLAIILTVLILAAVSTVLVIAWLLLTCGAIAAVGSAAVIDRLAIFRAARRQDDLDS